MVLCYFSSIYYSLDKFEWTIQAEQIWQARKDILKPKGEIDIFNIRERLRITSSLTYIAKVIDIILRRDYWSCKPGSSILDVRWDWIRPLHVHSVDASHVHDHWIVVGEHLENLTNTEINHLRIVFVRIFSDLLWNRINRKRLAKRIL